MRNEPRNTVFNEEEKLTFKGKHKFNQKEKVIHQRRSSGFTMDIIYVIECTRK